VHKLDGNKIKTYFTLSFLKKGTIKQAESVCGKSGMELMSIESLAEMDSVKGFLGNIGLSSETLLTSMKKVTDGTGNWLGDIGASLMAAKPSDPAKDEGCLGLGSLGLVGVTCDMVSNFVCEAPDVPSFSPSSGGSLEYLFFYFLTPVSLLKLFYLLSDLFKSLPSFDSGMYILYRMKDYFEDFLF